MRVFRLSNKTYLVRHWFKWYRVMRGGTDWQKMKVQPRPVPLNLKKISEALQKEYGKAKLPEILDELKADRQVAKALKKARADQKKRGSPKTTPEAKLSS